MSERIYENDLRLPALYLISMRNGNINTSELSNMLKNILKLTPKQHRKKNTHEVEFSNL